MTTSKKITRKHTLKISNKWKSVYRHKKQKKRQRDRIQRAKEPEQTKKENKIPHDIRLVQRI